MTFAHGPMNCSRCWKDDDTVQTVRAFQLTRNPAHVGASSPKVMVLGISKGPTQNAVAQTGAFEKVAFAGMRHRLLDVLQCVGLLQTETHALFWKRFTAAETEWAFGSVVRCTLNGLNDNKCKASGEPVYTADSPLVTPALRPDSTGFVWAKNCVDEHLGELPATTKLVLLLGTTPGYVKALRSLIGDVRGSVSPLNDIAYVSMDFRFVHITHPSPANGHFSVYVDGRGKPGRKRDLAREAIAATLD